MSNINEANITLRPVDVFYGTRGKDSVTCVADVADSLNNTYFEFETIDIDGLVAPFFAWFDTGAGVEPAGTGTAIQVSIATGATAAVVATALDAALTASAGRFSNSVSSAVVTIEAGSMGALTSTNDAGATGFTFVSLAVGESFEFGATDDISLSSEFTYVDVMASQLGETLLDQIQNGNNISVTVPCKEVVAALFKETLGEVAGDVLTVGTDDVIGIGESKRFNNMKQFSKELMLRPANETTLVNAWTVWKSKPDLTGLNFSGSDLQILEIEFSAYRDSNRPAKVSLAAFGKSDKGMLA